MGFRYSRVPLMNLAPEDSFGGGEAILDPGESGTESGGQPGKDPYNEVRKTQRLLAKQQSENQQLRQKLDTMLPQFEKFSQFFSTLEGGGKGEDPEPDDTGRATGLYDKARRMHEMLTSQNPDSPGIGLTVESAQLIKQLMEENKSMKSRFSDMEKKTAMLDNPVAFAEQTFYVSASAALREQLNELYGDDAVASENYEDFERRAGSKLRDIKEKSPNQYMKLLRDNGEMTKFVRSVIESKFPKAYNTREGFRKLDDYGIEDARRDMLLVQSGKVKDPREASRIQAKARQRLLSSMAEDLIPRR